MSRHTLAQPLSPSEPEAPGRRWSPRRVALAGYLAGILLMVGMALLGLWLAKVWRGHLPVAKTGDSVDVQAPAALERTVVSDAELADRIGVQIVHVAVTGGGGLVDLRYKVVDPDKAVAVHDAVYPPTIIDDATGIVVDQLLMGHSHTGSFRAGQTYYLIFENPGNLVQRGSTVSVLLGDTQIDNVDVK